MLNARPTDLSVIPNDVKEIIFLLVGAVITRLCHLNHAQTPMLKSCLATGANYANAANMAS